MSTAQHLDGKPVIIVGHLAFPDPTNAENTRLASILREWYYWRYRRAVEIAKRFKRVPYLHEIPDPVWRKPGDPSWGKHIVWDTGAVGGSFFTIITIPKPQGRVAARVMLQDVDPWERSLEVFATNHKAAVRKLIREALEIV